jgi:hypothetical protein
MKRCQTGAAAGREHYGLVLSDEQAKPTLLVLERFAFQGETEMTDAKQKMPDTYLVNPISVLRDCGRLAADIWGLMFLRQQKSGECYQSLRHIADDVEAGRTQAIEAVHRLVKDGYIEAVARADRQPVHYRLTDKAWDENNGLRGRQAKLGRKPNQAGSETERVLGRKPNPSIKKEKQHLEPSRRTRKSQSHHPNGKTPSAKPIDTQLVEKWARLVQKHYGHSIGAFQATKKKNLGRFPTQLVKLCQDAEDMLQTDPDDTDLQRRVAGWLDRQVHP